VSQTLTAYNTIETAKLLTKPYFLIELGFSVTLYMSTLKDIVIDSNLYSASRMITVGNMKPDDNGDIKSSVIIDNVDNALSVLTLAESPSGLSVVIYKAYGDSPTQSDLVKIFDGVMGLTKIDDRSNNVTINVSSKSIDTLSPGLVISRPTFNWLPPSGTTIKTGNTILTLQSGNS
jgi:hypothetical protein